MTPIHMRNEVSRIHQAALRAGKTPFQATMAVTNEYVCAPNLKDEEVGDRMNEALRYFGGEPVER